MDLLSPYIKRTEFYLITLLLPSGRVIFFEIYFLFSLDSDQKKSDARKYSNEVPHNVYWRRELKIGNEAFVALFHRKPVILTKKQIRKYGWHILDKDMQPINMVKRPSSLDLSKKSEFIKIPLYGKNKSSYTPIDLNSKKTLTINNRMSKLTL